MRVTSRTLARSASTRAWCCVSGDLASIRVWTRTTIVNLGMRTVHGDDTHGAAASGGSDRREKNQRAAPHLDALVVVARSLRARGRPAAPLGRTHVARRADDVRLGAPGRVAKARGDRSVVIAWH